MPQPIGAYPPGVVRIELENMGRIQAITNNLELIIQKHLQSNCIYGSVSVTTPRRAKTWSDTLYQLRAKGTILATKPARTALQPIATTCTTQD